MDWSAFAAGFLGGVAAFAALHGARALARVLTQRLRADDHLLLRAARTAGGRLIFRTEPLDAATAVLLLKELPNQPPLPNRGQVQRLLQQGLLQADPGAVPGRYLLTPRGWTRSAGLPPLCHPVARQGAWFNSVSRRALRR